MTRPGLFVDSPKHKAGERLASCPFAALLSFERGLGNALR
jgi:hypothetical protein